MTLSTCFTNPLIRKLGIKPNQNILFLYAPFNYKKILGPLPDNITLYKKLQPNLDFIHFFTDSAQQLNVEFLSLKNALKSNGMLWISWPKQSAKIPTDLNENKVREIGLQHGLVDVKVCAVDNIWSALKFVYRSKDR